MSQSHNNRYSNGGRPHPRVPTVAEALPYSPFTSIVPFTLDTVPAPLALPSTSGQVFSSEEQKISAHGMLERLDAEANNAERASERLNRTLADVQHLLNPVKLTEFRFNKPARFNTNKPRTTKTAPTPSKVHLGAFAKMVLDGRVPNNRRPSTTKSTPIQKPLIPQSRPAVPAVPTPVSQQSRPTVPTTPTISTIPTVPIVTGTNNTPTPHQPRQVVSVVSIPITQHTPGPLQSQVQVTPAPKSIPAAPQIPPSSAPAAPQAHYPTLVHAQNAAAASQNSYIQNVSSSQPAKVAPAVVISRTLTDAERSQYVAFSESDVKRVEAEADRRLTSASLDQQEKANTAVSRLQNLTSEIFEAEDQLQPDTSGVVSSNAARFFNTEDSIDSETPILQPNVQVQLDVVLHKVAANGRLSSISAEDLGRIQRLCENATTAAGTANYFIDEDTSQDLEDWLRRIRVGEQGLNACKTLLRIMTAGREEKQLYSEEVLRSLLGTLTHVVESCIIPVVEMRSSGDTADAFKFASSQNKPLLQVLTACTRVLKLLGDLVAKTDVDESAIISAEFVCKTMVFVENATSEKDCALGIQRFETSRRAAMDVLAKIFARYPDQRQSIFDEILTSLEKLPVGRQSARQFKMIDAKPIQLVSALLMRLVQTSATRIRARNKSAGEPKAADEKDDSEDAESSDEDAESDGETIRAARPKPKKRRSTDGPDDLPSVANPLYEAALRDANYVVNYMLQRALTSTKSGDQPYRNLLDIFTEDFLSVLGNTDWPAAEAFLRVLLQKLFELSENHKGSAPSKAMALELMGTMATRITELRLQAQQASRHPNTDHSEVSAKLLDIHEGLIADEIPDDELFAFDGPYRIILEYLQARGTDDAELLTARGYHTVQWAKQVLKLSQGQAKSSQLDARLSHMISDPSWLESEYDFPHVSTEDGRFAAVLMTLNMPFCRAFNKIFSKLLGTMGGDQASLRSKSLKSIEQLLEMDPNILDQGTFVINSILKCLTDTSTQVRDSALGLIAKCLALRPKLDTSIYERIVMRAQDTNLHVRKRAMKMLKDIYLRNDALNIKASIADTLINRVTDSDESIVELARQTFEDIWMTPFHSSAGSDSDSVKKKLRLREQTTLVINIVKRKNESTESVLPELLQQILSDKSKSAKANFSVCTQMVKAMFEAIIDPTELPESPSQQHVLQTLTIFAAANAKLFTADQLQTLHPYVKNLSTDDNLLVYRSAIVILRHTLPYMKNLNRDFLVNIQQALLGSFTRLRHAELKEVATCLWTLDGELHNTERLVRIMLSIFDQINKSASANMSTDQGAAVKTRRLVGIAGHFGKAFHLDAHIGLFREKFPRWKGNSVASLAVDLICPFTSPVSPAELRQASLESVCMICQTWPDQFMRQDVCTSFELAFKSDSPELNLILVLGMKEFFGAGDKAGEGVEVGKGVAAGTERLGNTYLATDRDGAATSMAQRFLRNMLDVALSSADDLALTAVQVVASINRQGLVHPKEPGPCFIALGTCPDNKIANIAFQEHLTLYSKHEGMFEKEHLRAIHQTFGYQRDVIKNPLGYNGSPPTAKLHHFWEVLKTGKAKGRTKFLTTICGKAGMGFEVAKLDISGALPEHVSFTRFCTENLAFFDYNKFEELQHLIECVEKVMADSGTPIAHMVDVDVLRMRLDQLNQDVPMAGVENGHANGMPLPATQETSVDTKRLRQLAVYAQILLLLWELRTYLRRLWNVTKHQAQTKGKANKEGVRAPQRIPNSSGLTERYLARNQEIISSLSTPEDQLKICTSFSEVMAIDNELKVGKDEDEEMDLSLSGIVDAAGYETPSEAGSAGTSLPPGSGQKRGRKRKSVDGSTQNTPRKKGRSRKNSSVQGRSENGVTWA